MQENKRESSSEQYAKSGNKKLILIGIFFLIVCVVAWFFLVEYKPQTQEQTSIDFSTQDFDRLSGNESNIAMFPRGSAALEVNPKEVEMASVVLGSKAESIITLTAQNAPILFISARLAEDQQDGFSIDSACPLGGRIEAGSSCNIKVLWNPVSLRQIQNNLTLTWKEDSPSVFREEHTTIQLKAQSTDSKDCVICEDVRAEAEKKPRMVMGLDGQLHEVDPEGYVTVDGKRYRLTENDLLLDENGAIVGIAQPTLIPVGLNNEILGSISETQDVIAVNGEKIGRLLGDGTIVDSSLTVLGAALPVVSVMDNAGNIIAKMRADGTIIDSANNVIGRPLVDGSVIDLNGTLIGTLRPWGLALDMEGNIMGGIMPDGTIVNQENYSVARITPTGYAVNSTGEIVGGIVPRGVAVGSSCQALGEIGLNGQVKDSYEQIIGRSMVDGSVLSLENKEIGAIVSTGLIVNEAGMILGFVNSEGKAVDAKGSVIGCLNPDGSVAAGKRMLGTVMPKGRVIGRSCQVLGSVYPNGVVVSFNGEQLGRVLSDSYVKNAQNQIIGVVIPRGTAIAEGCRLLGLININGQIQDNMGLTLGCVTPEKTITNDQNEVIGAITPRGVVADSEGKIIGRMRIDGKVVNEAGVVIGCAGSNGVVTSLDGKVIGNVVGNVIGNKIYDENGNVIGTIMPDGTIVDENGNVIGTPSQTAAAVSDVVGTILDASGNPTGMSIVGNKVFDANGNQVGTIQSNGWVTDENGTVVGVVHVDGVIISNDGVVLGRYSRQTGAAVNAAGEKFARILPDGTAVALDKDVVLGALIPDKTPFMDLRNTFLGHLQIDGRLIGSAGETLGTVRADGSVVDKTGRLIGVRIPQGKVFSLTGKEIGLTNEKGDVLSPKQTKIGHVLGNGLVLSEDGKILGGVLPENPHLAMGTDGVIGTVTLQGDINDKSGRKAGRILPFGLVLNTEDEIIGHTVRIGAVISLNGTLLGWSEFDGTVTNRSGSFVGKISLTGAAFDKSGHVIGMLIPKAVAVSETGNLIAPVSPNGQILTATNTTAATVTASDYVYSGPRDPAGRILKPGVALDNDGNFLGWTRFDGAVENGKQVLGRVSYDNRILTSNGNILGSYVSFDTVAQNDSLKALGMPGEDGTLVSPNGNKIGQIITPTTVVSEGKLVGRLTQASGFVTDFTSGKTIGQTMPNGTLVQVGTNKVTGSVMMNNLAMNLTKHITGAKLSKTLPISLNLGQLGQSLLNNTVLFDGKLQAASSGSGVLYDARGKISGGAYEPTVFIGREGSLIGSSTGTAAIMKADKKVGSYMPFGSVLTPDTLWAGGRLPEGVAVTDDAAKIGVVSVDGTVLGANNAVMGRILSDGTAVGVTDRSLRTTMPYAGALAKQGLALGYKGTVIGRTTMSGDVLDADDKPAFRILDDGTILGQETPLAGVILPFVPAIGHDGSVLGSLSGDGKVMAYDGSTVGTIAINGAVKGKNSLKILGILVPEQLVTNDCKVIGQPAYNGQVINGKGEVVGRITPDKWAIDNKGEKIGRVTRNGLILSPEGDYLGRTLPDSTVVNPQGVNMGCARNDGSVVDNAGNVIGHVVDRGPVFDLDGNLIGRVKANGTIVDEQNAVIGKMLGDGKGTAVSLDGNVIGRMVSRDEELILNPDGSLAGTFGLDGTYKDPAGVELFKVLPDGDVIDPRTGRKIAVLGEDDSFLDEQGNPVSDITLLRDKSGNVLGIITGCDVINTAGEKIASIQPDGSVIDLNGERFGTILGDGTLLGADGSEKGRVSGTSTKLDRCGIKSVSGHGTAGASGRRIFIGDRAFGISPTGSLIDADGTVVGYMGEDGRPYSLDDKLLTKTDSEGRRRPDLNKPLPVNSEQLQQMQQLLAQKRQSMKDGIGKSGGIASLRPDAKTLARAKKKQDKDWGLPKIVSSWPVDMSRMILKDKAIPAVIVHSIDSRYATAPVTAVVERHVYAEEGRNIIIPAGSRLIGSFSGSPGSDHVAKMDISWSRLIRPDGSAFQFSATSGDAQGRGGVAAYLSEELIQRYGKPVLTASVTSAISYMTAVNDDITEKENGDTVQSSKSEAATSARDNFVDAMSQIFNQLLDEATNVKPVVFVPAGTRITVFPNEDLWLRSVDDDEEEFAQEFGQDASVQTAPVGSWVDNRGMPEISGMEVPAAQDTYYGPEDAYMPESQPVALEDVKVPEPQISNPSEPLYNGATQAQPANNLTERVANPILPKTASPSNRMF